MHHLSLYYYEAVNVDYTNFGFDLYITESTMYRFTLNTTGVINKIEFLYGVKTSKDNWTFTSKWSIK